MISRVLLFYYGDVTWWAFIYFNFYLWGSIYIQKPRNSILHVSIAEVSFCDFLISIHIISEFTRYGLQEKTELLILSFYFILFGNRKVMRLELDTHTALPLLAWAVNSHLPGFLRSEGKRLANFSFTAALNGGKLDFQFSSALRGGKPAVAALPLLSSAVKSIFQFSSPLSGGKLEIAYMLPVHMAEIFQSDFLSFLPFFCSLVGHGPGLSSTKWRMEMCE